MGLNTQTDEEGEIQIGPTDRGMVRLFVRTSRFELPMDFTPEEAEEIAAEFTAAAALARAADPHAEAKGKGKAPRKTG